MISAKRLAQTARKWERLAALARKSLMPNPVKEIEGSSCSTSSVAGKGHCVVYTARGRRFEIPLVYLGMTVFSELLNMSHAEFSFSGIGGKIAMHYDAAVMEYVMRLLRREASEEVERAFLSSMARPCHYGSGFTDLLFQASED